MRKGERVYTFELWGDFKTYPILVVARTSDAAIRQAANLCIENTVKGINLMEVGEIKK